MADYGKAALSQLADMANNPATILNVSKYGEYRTIGAAISAAQDTPTNPVLILIHPGVYKEHNSLSNTRNLIFRGVDRDTCIVKNCDGLYANAPFSVGGNNKCVIENLTIISDYTENPNFETNMANGTYAASAYTIHIDKEPPNAVDNFKVTIRNCILINNQTAVLGIGLHQNETVKIVDCELIKEVNSTLWSGDISGNSQHGALYMHPNTTAGVTNQNLIVDNSIIKTNRGAASRMFNAASNAGTLVSYYRIFFKSDNLDTFNLVENGTVPVSADSYGNNASNVNVGEAVEAWNVPTLLNSWVNYGGTEDTAGYYKDSYKHVYCKGLVKAGVLGQVIFTLPVGYRPSAVKYFPVISNNTPQGYLQVTAGGNVFMQGGSNTYVSLDSISFRAT